MDYTDEPDFESAYRYVDTIIEDEVQLDRWEKTESGEGAGNMTSYAYTAHVTSYAEDEW